MFCLEKIYFEKLKKYFEVVIVIHGRYVPAQQSNYWNHNYRGSTVHINQKDFMIILLGQGVESKA